MSANHGLETVPDSHHTITSSFTPRRKPSSRHPSIDPYSSCTRPINTFSPMPIASFFKIPFTVPAQPMEINISSFMIKTICQCFTSNVYPLLPNVVINPFCNNFLIHVPWKVTPIYVSNSKSYAYPISNALHAILIFRDAHTSTQPLFSGGSNTFCLPTFLKDTFPS